MKKLFLFACLSFFAFAVKAQEFTATYDPSLSPTKDGFGFEVKFNFTNKGIARNSTNSIIIVLNSFSINFDKGFYKKYYSKPTGKYYGCKQLKDLCTQTEMNGFWVHLEWEYNGKTYSNGRAFTGQQKGAVYQYTGIENYFTVPSDIPDGVKASAVTLKKIEISSCSVNTTDKIMDIINGLNR